MSKLFIFVAGAGMLLATIFLAACGPTQKVNDNGPTSSGSPLAVEPGKDFTIEYKSEPAQIVAGAPADLFFKIKDKKGATVTDLQIVHEKPIHLIAVSLDLGEFYHIHPELQPDGSYKVTHTFPNGGGYRLYADFTPIGAAQVVEPIDVKVDGAQRANVELVPDSTFEKTVDGLKVVMKPSADLKAGQELTLDFQMFEAASTKPVTDLQNYLGELAHFVLISQDLKDYVHVHPMSKGQSMDSMKMDEEKPKANTVGQQHSKAENKGSENRSEVSAHTAFPRAGLYKIWAQFQRGGKVIEVPFIVKVSEGDMKTVESNSGMPADAIKITVSSGGYEPSAVNVKKGQPIKLAFYRADGNNCGGEVVFSKLNIRKTLPVGETVLVEISPQESGEISFTCGMGMLSGKVVVQ